MKRINDRRTALAALLLLMALLLSACGGTIETDLTLYTGDRFEATSLVSVPAAGLTLLGGAAALDQQFDQLAQQARAEGAEFSWRKEKAKSADEIAYRITTSGTGYEGLASSYNIQVQKVKHEGKDALSISASPSYDLSGVQNTVRLHVGQVLQTVNQRSGNNTIIWSGSSDLQAIVTPAERTDWIPVLVGVLGALVLAVIAVVVLRRRPARRPRLSPAPAQVARGVFCPHCGRPVAANAKFCMNCGKAVPPRIA